MILKIDTYFEDADGNLYMLEAGYEAEELPASWPPVTKVADTIAQGRENAATRKDMAEQATAKRLRDLNASLPLLAAKAALDDAAKAELRAVVEEIEGLK